MPALKRFVEGQPVKLPARRSFPLSKLSVIGQAASIVLVLYLVFGTHVLDEYHPMFLITLPLIWIALQRGFKGTSLALLALNSGVVLALWLFRFDPAELGELELLMIVNCIVGLLMGAIVTERKLSEQALVHSYELLNLTGQMGKIGGWELDLETQTLSWTEETYRIHEVDPATRLDVAEAINFYAPEARPAISAAVQAGIDSGSPWDLELPLITARGQHIWVRAQGAAERRDGKTVRLYGAFQEITERKQAEEELVIANKELTFQNEEKEKRAAELVVANKELVFQNEEKEKRAAELVVANKELVFQNEEKEKRAAELVVANKELVFQNEEKEKRAEELVIANKELVFQNEEKEKRAEELVIANKELAFQNEEKEKRAVELSMVQMETVHRLRNIEALRTIDQAISGSLDLNITFSVILKEITSQLKVDAVDVLLLNLHTQTLEFAAGHGFRTDALQHTLLRLGEGYAGRAALERQFIHIPDLRGRKTDFLRSTYFSAEGFVTYYVVPLIAKGELKGVLEVFHRAPFEADAEWRAFFETLAGQAAIAIDNFQLFENLQRSNSELGLAYDATIEGWSHALDLRDKETEGHTQRVTEMTLILGRSFGLSEADMVQVRWGALLHDIGKMGVPDNILLKPGPLTDKEWVVMKKHPTFAYEMLSPIQYLKAALDIPYCHHEKWDGTGYPRGLQGEQIPLAARIFAVVDVWDALTSDRPYRKAWSEEKARQHIRAGAGTHFDPQVVKTFFTENGLNRI
jgi:putative nucleotidyltransferase with HDIG domain